VGPIGQATTACDITRRNGVRRFAATVWSRADRKSVNVKVIEYRSFIVNFNVKAFNLRRASAILAYTQKEATRLPTRNIHAKRLPKLARRY